MKLPKDKYIDEGACLVAAQQFIERRRLNGDTPESIFIENGGYIFRKPTWDDATNLIFIRLKNQDTLLENEPIVVNEISEEI